MQEPDLVSKNQYYYFTVKYLPGSTPRVCNLGY